MELTEYYLNLTDQFFIIETLNYENDGSVESLRLALEEIVLSMKIIREVYPEFQVIWGSTNLANELNELDKAIGLERRKDLFFQIKDATMECSKIVIPRLG